MDEPITLLFDRKLNLNLDLGPVELVPGVQGELGEPLEAFLRLYAVEGGEPLARIDTPHDLSRYVRGVDDAAQALEFVRLFTSPRTSYLFAGDPTCIECEVIPDGAPRAPGTLPAARAQQLGVPPPRVTLLADGFQIERAVVCSPALSAPRTLLLRTEALTRDGRYASIGERQLGVVPASEVSMPHFE